MSYLSESIRDPCLPDANLGTYLLFPTRACLGCGILRRPIRIWYERAGLGEVNVSVFEFGVAAGVCVSVRGQ
jgi:hypothetical protein